MRNRSKVGGKTLIRAVKEGNTELIDHCLNSDVNVNSHDPKGHTPLHLAAWMGNKGLVKKLLDHGANVTVRDKDGDTPLHVAAYKGHLESLQLLLHSSAEVVTYKNHNGNTPLDYALQREYMKAPKLLSNSVDRHGKTALEYAVKSGDARMTRLLLEQKEEINDNNKILFNNFLTIAMENDYSEIVMLLLEFGADVNSVDLIHRRTPLEYAVEGGNEKMTSFLLARKEKISALHKDPTLLNKLLSTAMDNNHIEVAMLLVESGANMNFVDRHGKTPLEYAVERSNEKMTSFLLAQKEKISVLNNDPALLNKLLSTAMSRGNSGMARLLIHHGADINFVDSQGKTALDYAVEKSNMEMTSFLLKGKQKTGKLDSDKPLLTKLLSTAMYKGESGIAMLLVNHGADVNFVDSYGKTALEYAVEKSNREMTSFLLKEKQKTGKLDSDKPLLTKLLSTAMDKGESDIAMLLINHGANINFVDSQGKTALEYAVAKRGIKMVSFLLAEKQKTGKLDSDKALLTKLLPTAMTKGDSEIAMLLINHGADINFVDSQGKTALDHAIETDNEKMAVFLLAEGVKISVLDSNVRVFLNKLLSATVEKEDMKMAALLIDSGADINYLDPQGRTILHYAAQRGHTAMVKFLIEKQALVNDIGNFSILNYYSHDPKMLVDLFEIGVVPDASKKQNQDLSNDLIVGKQSVHNTDAVKQIKFYITELKNTFKGSEITAAKLEEEASKLSSEIQNLFLDKKKKFLYFFSTKVKGSADLLSLPFSEKEDLLAPIFENVSEDQKAKYRDLVNGPNKELIKEIINTASSTLNKWLKKVDGQYVTAKSTDKLLYDNENTIILPHTLGLIKLLIDQQQPSSFEMRELCATLFEQRPELVENKLQKIRKILKEVSIQELTNKASCHKLLEKLGDQGVQDIYKVVTGESISTTLREQNLFKLAKGIFASAVSRGPNLPACLIGTFNQVVSPVGEISSAIEDKRQKTITPDISRSSIDKFNVSSVIEPIAEGIIEIAQQDPKTSKMLYNALLRLEEPYFELSHISEPGKMKIADQQLMSLLFKAISNNIRKALPNYPFPPVPKREELELVIPKLSENYKLQQWALNYTEPKSKVQPAIEHDLIDFKEIPSTAAKPSISPAITDTLRRSMESIPGASNGSTSPKRSYRQSIKEKQSSSITP